MIYYKYMVTYAMGNVERDRDFRTDYFHLYYRLRRLSDNLTSLYLCGDIHVIVPEGYSAKNVPKFLTATFDERAAHRYELRVERILSKLRGYRDLPPPDFPVSLEIGFSDGTRETFSIDFSAADAVAVFCGAVCTCARNHFRNRFLSEKADGGKRSAG